MRGRPRRTLVAALLTTAAVAVPCAAWWTVGSRAVQREQAALRASVEADARRQAVHLAERLRGRLDGVLRQESQRPYFEYAYRYQDPKLSCDCASWVESPLARGPSEPLIRAHFEINRQGILSVPSIPPDDVRTQEGIRVPDAVLATADTLRAATGALARAAWGAERAEVSADAVTVAYGDETVLVDPFRWSTVDIGGRPHLVAVRTVRPPEGSRLQGFVVSTEAVQAALPAGSYDAVFRPAGAPPAGPEPDGRVAETLDLPGASWEVALDVGDVRKGAVLRGDTLRRDFLRLFLGGSGAAALAAVFLVSLVAQSERVARDRSRFAAAAAPELRTPLSGIRVYGEMLADDLGDPARRRAYARQVASEAERLGRVVSNVLGHAKLERGQLAPRPVPGDLPAAIRDAVDRMRPAVEAHGATVALDVASPLPDVPFDPDALQQMLANLVDNAERYSRAAPDRRIHVHVRPAGNGVAIRVTDHGAGIAPRDRKRLFRPFRRGDDPDAPGGLGLGLAMVAELARAHGGRVRCEDAPGGGSRFVVELPGTGA
jgi:signal transduction histidine kinase